MQFLLIYKNVESQLPQAKEDLNNQRASSPRTGIYPPPAPLRLFPEWCTKAIQALSSDQHFPTLEFWRQYQLKQIPSLATPGWFFLLYATMLWFLPTSPGSSCTGAVTVVQKTQPPSDHILPLSSSSNLALPWEPSPLHVPAPGRICNTSHLCFSWGCVLAG